MSRVDEALGSLGQYNGNMANEFLRKTGILSYDSLDSANDADVRCYVDLLCSKGEDFSPRQDMIDAMNTGDLLKNTHIKEIQEYIIKKLDSGDFNIKSMIRYSRSYYNSRDSVVFWSINSKEFQERLIPYMTYHDKRSSIYKDMDDDIREKCKAYIRKNGAKNAAATRKVNNVSGIGKYGLTKSSHKSSIPSKIRNDKIYEAFMANKIPSDRINIAEISDDRYNRLKEYWLNAESKGASTILYTKQISKDKDSIKKIIPKINDLIKFEDGELVSYIQPSHRWNDRHVFAANSEIILNDNELISLLSGPALLLFITNKYSNGYRDIAWDKFYEDLEVAIDIKELKKKFLPFVLSARKNPANSYTDYSVSNILEILEVNRDISEFYKNKILSTTDQSVFDNNRNEFIKFCTAWASSWKQNILSVHSLIKHVKEINDKSLQDEYIRFINYWLDNGGINRFGTLGKYLKIGYNFKLGGKI